MDIANAMAVPNVADRAVAYAMPGVAIDGNDLPLVAAAARVAIDRARSGGGPSLVECKTYRLRGHSKSDRDLAQARSDRSPGAGARRARAPRLLQRQCDSRRGADRDRRGARIRQVEP